MLIVSFFIATIVLVLFCALAVVTSFKILKLFGLDITDI